MSKKLTTVEFIANAQAVHGLGKYDYSQTVYKTAHDRITIICPQHGAFEQKAYTHSQGRGCAKCALLTLGSTNKLSTESFVDKAVAVHKGRYDYSLASYERTDVKVQISCLIHGAFEQTPNMHLRGRGCPSCATQERNRAISRAQTEWTTEKLRARCQEQQPSLDFSKLEYTGPKNPVRVICPLHGEYLVRNFYNLLAGNVTCKACRSLPGSRQPRKTRATWLEEFAAIHKGRYGYELVAEKFTARQEIIITCPIHGVFNQKPAVHIQGHGCRMCTANLPWAGLGAGRGGTLYVLRLFNATESFYKVGVTALSYKKRYSNLRALGYEYEPIATYYSPNAQAIYDLEQSILSSYNKLRYFPKLRFGGRYECFVQVESILSALPAGAKHY